MNSLFKILVPIFCLIFSSSFAQIDDDLLEEDSLNLKTSVIPELDAAKKEEKEIKKLKKKKNLHFGIRTKKTFTKKVIYQQDQYEVFSYAKVYAEPNTYLKEIFWYDRRKGIIVKTANANKIDKSSMRLLHGPYYRKIGDVILDSGAYYLGSKHNRWEHYASNGFLSNKFYYNKGWLKHSEMTYYDVAGTKIKEIIPIHNGKKRGTYYSFYENGNVSVEGKYDHDVKIGKWMEFYPNRFRKKEMQYPNDPLDTETEMLVVNEWDENGKIIGEEVKNLSSSIVSEPLDQKSLTNTTEKKNTSKKEKYLKTDIDKPIIKIIIEESSIKIRDKIKRTTTYYTLVSPSEGNMKKNKIAIDSPIGKQLMGKKAGEIVKIKVPSGEVLEWEVMEIY